MTPESNCPTCGGRLGNSVPGQLCLRCLLSFGLKSEHADTVEMPQTLAVEGQPELEEIAGRYRLIEAIGEGGCGIVYRAEQLHPVRREVALKVIKLGMDTRNVIARFESERQALAMMDHPGIAKVFDGGTTATGRPFFVMELVPGEPITTFCERRHLSLEKRLQLFVRLCQAVQHAHQKGVIHRDIKPSNVLVIELEGEPCAKVIDFGVARATSRQRLADQTVYTAFDQFVGTPAYMSPEQAGLTGEDVDTRTDIYSLGVLLYELLTGMPPFDPQRLRNAALDEVCRIIRDEEPVRPSTRVGTTLHTQREDAGNADARPDSRWSRQLRGDLDWIVMKALEKERARRYETANALAEDIQRHLGHEPVQARPSGAFYRLWKLARRNKVGVISGLLVLGSLIGALFVSIWRFEKEKHARELAVAAERAATAQRTRSDETARFLKEMLASAGPSVALGRDSTLLREVLDHAAGRIAELRQQPEVESELRVIMGRVYADLTLFEKAESMFRAALRVREELYGPEHELVAESLLDLTRVLNHRANPEDLIEAEPLARRALAIRQKLNKEGNLKVAGAIEMLAWNLRGQRKMTEAEALFRESLALRRRLVGDRHLEVTFPLNSLAIILSAHPDKLGEAEALVRESLEIRRRESGPSDLRLTEPLGILGSILRERGKTVPGKSAEAEVAIRDAIEIYKKHLGPTNANLPDLLNLLAANLRDQRKFPEAEAAIHEAMAVQAALTGSEHPRFARWFFSTLTGIYHDQRKWPEAEKTLRDWLALCEKVGAEPGILMDLYYWKINVLTAQQRWEEAEPVLRERLTLCERIHPGSAPGGAVPCLHIRVRLGEALRRNGHLAEAERVLLPAYEGLQNHTGRWERVSLWNSADQIMKLHETAGRTAEAGDWRQRRSAIHVPAE